MCRLLVLFWAILAICLVLGDGYMKSSQSLQQRQFRCIFQASRKPAGEDIISKIFGAFLPTPESIGLSRFDSNSRPENYPATKDEFAELLPEDKDCDVKLIRPLLAKTNLQFRPLTLAYSANKDGWNSKDFHTKVDKKGPSLVLCRSKSGVVLGGYNPTGWVNLGEYRGSIAAFLFVYPKETEKNAAPPIKLQKISGAGMAQVDDGSGPRFGSEGLTIALNKSNPKLARSKLGLYYERLPDGGNSLLGKGIMEDELTDLKVFVGVYGKDERVPYSDAMFFQIN